MSGRRLPARTVPPQYWKVAGANSFPSEELQQSLDGFALDTTSSVDVLTGLGAAKHNLLHGCCWLWWLLWVVVVVVVVGGGGGGGWLVKK